MSRYDAPELIRLWALEKITAEQTIGQILQHMQELIDRVTTIEQRLRTVRRGGQSEPPDIRS